MATDPGSLERGRVVAGKYDLVELAGEGGMATVWRAQMRGAAGFSRQVAVKKMKPEFRAVQNYVAMFVEEARVGSELQHPNIVQVYDFCQDADGMYCLVTDWVEGLDLGTFIRAFRRRGQKTPWPMIAAIGVGALRGLAAAHDRTGTNGEPAPVIHRDVSPHNILLGVNGIVKLTDFGLARARDRMHSLTAPGTVKGKLSYLAPEIVSGQDASALSDLFAMGSVLWEALAGRPLFDGATDIEVFRKIRRCEVLPLDQERADLPRALVELIHRALALSPADRFPTSRQMAQELAALLAGVALGTDAQTVLGRVVAEARAWVRSADDAESGQSGPRTEVDLSISSIEVVEPILLTRRKED